MTPKKKRAKDAPLKNFVVWVDEVYRTSYEARARDVDHAVALVRKAVTTPQPGLAEDGEAFAEYEDTNLIGLAGPPRFEVDPDPEDKSARPLWRGHKRKGGPSRD